MLIGSGITQDKFVAKWAGKSYNSGQMAEKSLKKYNKFLISINETNDSIFEKLHPIKGSEDFYLFLNKIVEYFGETLSPRATSAYFSFIKDYYRKNGYRIYNEDIKQFVDMPKNIKERKVPLEMSSIKILVDNADRYLKGIILCLVSSGMRSSEFLQLKESDIKWNLDPVEVHLRAEITKTKVDRITFLSPQAVEHFPKLKKYDQQKSLINLEQIFSNLRKKCDLNEKYRNTNVHHITPHRLRAYFKTEASNMHGKDYAEYIIGHEGKMNTYYSTTHDDLVKKYKELLPKITV